MPTHAEILEALCTALGGPVTLVSRLVEPGVRIPSTTALVFLPDLHLITPEAAEKYEGFFFRESLRPMLEAVLQALERIQGLDRIQLGDRYDLWRELVVKHDRTPLEVVADIRHAHGLDVDSPARPSWQFLAGNHDAELG